MSALATLEQPAAPNATKSAQKQRISKRLGRALDILAKGKAVTIKAAAEAVKMSPEHLSRSLRKDHVRVFIAQRSRATIAVGALRASERIIELVDASSEHVSLDASKTVLAIEGIKPVESGTNINITNNIAPGYVIDLRDPRLGAGNDPIATGASKPLITLDAVRDGDE